MPHYTPEQLLKRARERWAGSPAAYILAAEEVAREGFDDERGTMVRMRVAARKRWQPHNTAKAIGAQLKAQALEPGYKERQRAATDLGKARAAMRHPNRPGQTYTSEERERRSAKLAEQWTDPTFRAIMADKMRRAAPRRRDAKKARQLGLPIVSIEELLKGWEETDLMSQLLETDCRGAIRHADGTIKPIQPFFDDAAEGFPVAVWLK